MWVVVKSTQDANVVLFSIILMILKLYHISGNLKEIMIVENINPAKFISKHNSQCLNFISIEKSP